MFNSCCIKVMVVYALSAALFCEAAEDAIAVKHSTLKQLIILPEISAPATVVSLSDSRIGAELNAIVADIPVRIGDIVKPGGILARLDCGDYELTEKELQARQAAVAARLQFAQEQLRRVRSLKRQRTVSQELLDERETSVAEFVAQHEELAATIAKAQRNLNKCIIRAPFKAAILERVASQGEYAMIGSPLIRVLDVSSLEISADVLAEDADTLNAAKAIKFRVGEHDYPVVLRVLAPVIDSLTLTREARLLLSEQAALPGATGRLVWHTEPALPADLLVRRDGTLGVLLVDGNRARFYPMPNAREGRPAAINTLPEEALIITEGRSALKDGDPIRLLD